MKALDIQIKNKYRVERKIGEGGFGEVYSGIDLNTDEEIAIKLQYIGDNMPILEREADIYKDLSGGVGIPCVRWYGEECDFYAMIFDLLGPSLEDLFNFCDRQFSLKTVLLLADQLIPRIEYIHSKSYIHRDIKPENFLMGTGKLGNLVHVIDFDTAKEYRDPETGVHKPRYDNCKFGGTSRYATINNHLEVEQSRRDDLESLGYMMIYFVRGSLPWQSLKAATEDERNRCIKEKKIHTSIKELCRQLPKEFATYLNYVRNLDFDEPPNYPYLRKLFSDLFVRKKFEYDDVFDWTIKKYFMIHECIDPPSTIQTRSTTKGNKSQYSSAEAASGGQSRPLSGQSIGQRVSKRTRIGRLGNPGACKKRQT
ncbi:CK1 protein kinase, variant [Venustampulla echinocandica]|uniref:non-specific serine/threonine protein kinase n=1 Tax=Venustampulla echinocandica TaxID=2656787 RepID=A0A370TXM5_9HELO|nr:CK1 protein kinase, variant [Venustampulla echinocandica]RDL40263.1 CK1 protein kinase, variant [Venustampulla echinocandica]